MPSLNVTQKSAIVYFNTPEGVDLCGQEGTVVALTANPDIPEFIGTPLSAIPTQTQLLGVVLQGQPNQGTCVAALVGMYAGLIKRLFPTRRARSTPERPSPSRPTEHGRPPPAVKPSMPA